MIQSELKLDFLIALAEEIDWVLTGVAAGTIDEPLL